LSFQIKILFCIFIFILSCQSSHHEDIDMMSSPTKARPRPPQNQLNWAKKLLVDQKQTGLYPKLSIAKDQTLAVAYWSSEGKEAESCTGINVMDPPKAIRWDLKYAQFAQDAWSNETIDQPILLGNPPGLDMIFNDQDLPMISALSGEVVPMVRYCGGSDFGLYQRKNTSNIGADTIDESMLNQSFDENKYLLKSWQLDFPVTLSNQASAGLPDSDYGYVVGYWPSIAQSPNGDFLIAYQDVHGGGLQRDDLARADLEIAIGKNGAWQYEAIDFGEGAGIHISTAFDAMGNPMVLYEIPFEAVQSERNRQGLWLTRKINGTWERVQLAKGPQKGKASLLSLAQKIVVAHYDPQQRLLNLLELNDLSTLASIDAWQRTQLGDLRYNDGQMPSLAVDQLGRLALAWYRCGTADDENCTPTEDGVVFAWQSEVGSSQWEIEWVEQGEEAICGLNPSLVFNDQNEAVIAWQCFRRSEDGNGFESRLESAFRIPLETNDQSMMK
jgi:hypothetical protein